jgi:hypothetical protein
MLQQGVHQGQPVSPGGGRWRGGCAGVASAALPALPADKQAGSGARVGIACARRASQAQHDVPSFGGLFRYVLFAPQMLSAISDHGCESWAAAGECRPGARAQHRAATLGSACGCITSTLMVDGPYAPRPNHWLVLLLTHHESGHCQEARSLFCEQPLWVGQAFPDRLLCGTSRSNKRITAHARLPQDTRRSEISMC